MYVQDTHVNRLLFVFLLFFFFFLKVYLLLLALLGLHCCV